MSTLQTPNFRNLLLRNAQPKFLGRSPATLKRWRYEGTGPEYVQIEGRVDTTFEFFSITPRRTPECLPCGLQWRKLVELHRKRNSKFYWYDFTVRGQRYRGSTKETNITVELFQC
jgi:hypothetical protein